jgi:hypothetical protein
VARFRLLTDHWLEVSGVAQLLGANTEIDTAELPPSFRPSPHMQSLDPQARALLFEVAAEIRNANRRNPNIAGVGHREALPGGDFYKEPS